MKERPILFNGEMVKAVLDGRKTQTRRVIKLRNGKPAEDDDIPAGHPEIKIDYVMDFSKHYPQWERRDCPYGKPGDRLWVRETWCDVHPTVNGEIDRSITNILYRASKDDPTGVYDGCWKPSIYMHRDYSRITLEVTDVRVERVQEITEADALSEGLDKEKISYQKAEGFEVGTSLEKFHFRVLWDSINEKRGFGWEKNPWVWVVKFKEVKK